MSVQNPPLWIQAGGETAEIARRFNHALLDGRGGIASAGDIAVTQNGTPNMSVNVATGRLFIPGTQNGFQGIYFVENRGALNVGIAAADATNPRKDLIVAQVADAAYSGVANTASITAVTGTPAASPTEPAVPANAWVLAMVDVPATDTTVTNAQITDRRTSHTGQGGRAAALGGVIACTSTNRPAHQQSRVIYETDTDRVWASTGTAWRPVNQRCIQADISTSQSTTSTSFTDLATVGPSVSRFLETGQECSVTVSAVMFNNGVNFCLMGFAVSGASVVAAADATAGHYKPAAGNSDITVERESLYVATATGTHTFTAKYRASAGTANFYHRRIIAKPL